MDDSTHLLFWCYNSRRGSRKLQLTVDLLLSRDAFERPSLGFTTMLPLDPVIVLIDNY